MPLTTDGENYRDFSEPKFYEAETTAQVRQIEYPTDKSFALVGADDGSTDLAVWKFDKASTSVASATVLVPNNPLYTASSNNPNGSGRWIFIPTGGGGGGGASFLSGHGSPEGAIIGAELGQTYLDLDSGGLWAFSGTVGTMTGWV